MSVCREPKHEKVVGTVETGRPKSGLENLAVKLQG